MSSSPKPEKSVNDQDKEKKPVVKDAYDLQRLKLEKLMKNPVMSFSYFPQVLALPTRTERP